VPGPQAQDVAATVQVDPDRGLVGLVADLPVADLDVDRVDEDRRVHRLQRTRGPGLHLPRKRGHPHSTTLSVILEIVSLETLTPYTAPARGRYPQAKCALISPVVKPLANKLIATARDLDAAGTELMRMPS